MTKYPLALSQDFTLQVMSISAYGATVQRSLLSRGNQLALRNIHHK